MNKIENGEKQTVRRDEPGPELSPVERAFLERRARTNEPGWAERLHRLAKNPPLFFWWYCW